MARAIVNQATKIKEAGLREAFLSTLYDRIITILRVRLLSSRELLGPHELTYAIEPQLSFSTNSAELAFWEQQRATARK